MSDMTLADALESHATLGSDKCSRPAARQGSPGRCER